MKKKVLYALAALLLLASLSACSSSSKSKSGCGNVCYYLRVDK